MSLHLGDRLKRIINKVVPKSIIKKIEEKPGGCGCGKRQEFLNDLI